MGKPFGLLFFPIIITREGRFFNRFWAGVGGSPPGRGGGFCPSWKRGDGYAPHFFFSRERKRNVPISAPSTSLRSVALRNAPAGAGPVQRKRALGAAFVAKAAPFSFVLYILKTSALVLCGLVLPLAPLPLSHTHVIIRKNMYYLDYLTIQQCSLCWFCKLKQVVSIQKLVHHEYLTHSCCKLVANSLTILRLLFEKNQNPRAIPEFVDTFYHL